ncbi:MAG TPA: protein-glutamate O-methyltransferase CheR [Terracidiphilus sp.]|nr:protein-glutamate O-methyltransferase CheR [Terracidiphilus sp.]
MTLAGKACSADYGYLRRVVLARSQNVLDPSRDFLFEAKLAPLVRNRGLDDLHELVEYMRHARDMHLESAVADAMTVNETSFFRDSRPFELLRRELLPELVAARGGTQSLRIWSAACSTGQEPYSLAILIREHFRMLAGWKVRIEGTDLCREVLERAKEASYERIEVNRGLPARYLAQYFHHAGERWVVKPETRALCSFRQMNLADTPLPFSHRFDVILMRNVMLYFGPQVRRTVMAEVHRLLAPDGVLVMGATEQPPEKSFWKASIAGGACYFRPVKQ